MCIVSTCCLQDSSACLVGTLLCIVCAGQVHIASCAHPPHADRWPICRVVGGRSWSLQGSHSRWLLWCAATRRLKLLVCGAAMQLKGFSCLLWAQPCGHYAGTLPLPCVTRLSSCSWHLVSLYAARPQSPGNTPVCWLLRCAATRCVLFAHSVLSCRLKQICSLLVWFLCVYGQRPVFAAPPEAYVLGPAPYLLLCTCHASSLYAIGPLLPCTFLISRVLHCASKWVFSCPKNVQFTRAATTWYCLADTLQLTCCPA